MISFMDFIFIMENSSVEETHVLSQMLGNIRDIEVRGNKVEFFYKDQKMIMNRPKDVPPNQLGPWIVVHHHFDLAEY